jgi:hypothetical protein
MKLLDITLAVANDPNTLFEVNNHNGYYRITGFGERRTYGSQRKTLKTVTVVRVFFKKAQDERTGYEGELIPAQPDRIVDSTYTESFLPSQIANPVHRYDDELGKAVPLTMDNFLQYELLKTERLIQRQLAEHNELERKVSTLSAFLGESFEVKPHHFSDKYWMNLLLEAVINKLQPSEVNA